ncbi:MAG: UDP-N-acetylglucosamine 2-epimerase (non-hydrolyzing) [Pseudomonadota bacterium]
MKVMTVVGTRPEIIKLCRVISELDACTQHILVHTGQNFDFELNEIFFEQLGIRKPDFFLNAARERTAETIAAVIFESDKLFERETPDALLVLGDTNSCLAAYAAKRRKIPVFHMEAGNRCFDQRVPEEINRKIIDHISDINMPYTEHARRYLMAEGVRPETIIKTGSPMKEVLDHYLTQIDDSPVLDTLGLVPGQFFIVSAHREENIDSAANFADLLETLEAITAAHGMPIIFSTHPRTRKRLEAVDSSTLAKTVRFMKPLGFADYVKLQMNAYCAISDSGTITEESSIMNFPAVTIRQAHERQEGMDEGTLIMCGLKADRVLGAIDTVRRQWTPEKRRFRLVADYDVDNVSQKVVRIILSYTDTVNRTVWFKND